MISFLSTTMSIFGTSRLNPEPDLSHLNLISFKVTPIPNASGSLKLPPMPNHLLPLSSPKPIFRQRNLNAYKSASLKLSRFSHPPSGSLKSPPDVICRPVNSMPRSLKAGRFANSTPRSPSTSTNPLSSSTPNRSFSRLSLILDVALVSGSTRVSSSFSFSFFTLADQLPSTSMLN